MMASRIFTAGASLLALLLTAPPVKAAPPSTVEKTVYAQVLKVVPITRSSTQCNFTDKPSQSQGLLAQLNWDFSMTCENHPAQPRAYHVTYTWDGRTYTQTLRYDPGKRLPLQVRFR